MSKKKLVKKIRAKTPNKIVSLKEKLQAVYNYISLDTTCPGHCVCCNVACPQMNYSEFLVILDKIYNDCPKYTRLNILKTSIKYFFSQSIVKPCPLLDGTHCSVYKDRPLSCRMYGLWPEDAYEERVSKFMEATGMKREEIPLNTQCKYVKRVDESKPLTKEVIDGLYQAINDIDISIEKYTEEQVSKKYNQRTWHDWFMVTVFGENNLADMSKFFLAAPTKEVIDDFVSQMLNQVDIIGDRVFKRQ